MKKLFTVLTLAFGLGLGTAQQVTPKTTTAPAKAVKLQTAKPAAATAKPAASNSAVKLKKDGTPDKRYKANEHLKKDGTPDKRYKTK